MVTDSDIEKTAGYTLAICGLMVFVFGITMFLLLRNIQILTDTIFLSCIMGAVSAMFFGLYKLSF